MIFLIGYWSLVIGHW